jgi:parallel beta-helix repeat protein
MLTGARLRCAALSDAGLQRKNNEDRVYTDARSGVFLVVDGVGGHAAGEKAADTAVKVIRARLARQTGSVEERIREAITLANNEILRLAQSNERWHGMACVLTLAVLEEDRAAIGHVGDSRCYELRPGNIFKLTHDHSPVGELEDRGDLTEAAAMAHPRRNEIFRDVGSIEHAPDDPDFIEIAYADFSPDAALVLCSDGLSDQVSSEEIRAVVEKHAGDPAAAGRELIDLANAAGGKDNASIIIVEGAQFAAKLRKGSGAAASAVTALPRRRSRLASGLAMLLGVLAAAAAFVMAKPYLERTADGLALGWGEVRRPAVWEVGEGLPLASISAALEAAAPGDRIVVSPGVYRETIRLKSHVAVEGAQLNGAVLEAAGVAVTAQDIRGARFSRFRIRQDRAGALQAGLRLIDSAVEVSAIEITDARNAGIEIIGASRPLLMANRVVGNWGAGVVIRDSAAPQLLNNVVSGNGKHTIPRRSGVEIHGAADPLLLQNVIYDNGAEPIQASPLIRTDAILRQNFFGPAALPRGQRPLRVAP